MSADTAIAAAVIVPTALIVAAAWTAGLVADRRIKEPIVRDPSCDCGAEPGEECAPACMSWEGEPVDAAAQALAEDGYAFPRSASVIRHPSHARTRAHFAERPFPRQRDRGAA